MSLPKKKLLKISNKDIVNINVNLSFDIQHKLDLDEINRKIENLEYYSEKLNALTIRYENPCSSVLIFSTGKMIITSLKKVSDIKKVIKKIRKSLNANWN